MANACVLKKVNKRMLSSSSSSESGDSSTSSSSENDSFDEEGLKRVTYNEWRSYLMKMKPPNPFRNDATTPNPYKPVVETTASCRTDASTPNPYRVVVPTHNSYRMDPPPPSSFKNNTQTPNYYRTDAQTPNPHKNGTSTPNLTRTVNASNIKTVASSLTRTKPTAPPPKHIRTVVPAMKPPNTVPSTSRASQTPDLSASLRSIYETFWSLNSAAKLVHVKSQLDEPSKIYVLKLIKTHSNFAQENSRLKKEKQDLINTLKRIQLAINNETITNLLDPTRSTQPKK